MAYSLEALIGPSLGPRPGLPPLTVVVLAQDLALLPLVPDLVKALGPLADGDDVERMEALEYVKPGVLWLAERLSAAGRIAYGVPSWRVGEQISGLGGGELTFGPVNAGDDQSGAALAGRGG
jgi:hypothetical protein